MATVVPWHTFHGLAQIRDLFQNGEYSKSSKSFAHQILAVEGCSKILILFTMCLYTSKSFLHTWVRHFSKSFRTNQWKTHNHHTLYLPPTQDAIITTMTRMTWNILESGIPTTKPLFPTNCIPGIHGEVDQNHTFFLEGVYYPKNHPASQVTGGDWNWRSPPRKEKKLVKINHESKPLYL